MLTLSQAAKRTGKSKSVISRALNNGDLTACKNDDNTYAIHEDDLFALYPELVERPAENAQQVVQNDREREERLQLQLVDTKTEQIDLLKQHISDLQRQLNQATIRDDHLTKLLIAKEQSLQKQGVLLLESQKKKSLFSWF